jgi:hypothetical protein
VQVKEGSVTKHKFQRYYDGSEAVVAGRVEEDVAELTPQVHAFCGVNDLNSRVTNFAFFIIVDKYAFTRFVKRC